MNQRGRQGTQPERAPWILETACVVLLLFNMLLSGAVPTSEPSGSAVIGALFAPLLIGLIVVGVASVFKNCRTRRSRAIIFLVTMTLMLVGSCGNLASVARQRRAAEHSLQPSAPDGRAVGA
jgi:hypothetical protein